MNRVAAALAGNFRILPGTTFKTSVSKINNSEKCSVGFASAKWLVCRRAERRQCGLRGGRLRGCGRLDGQLTEFAKRTAEGIVDDQAPRYPFPEDRLPIPQLTEGLSEEQKAAMIKIMDVDSYYVEVMYKYRYLHWYLEKWPVPGTQHWYRNRYMYRYLYIEIWGIFSTFFPLFFSTFWAHFSSLEKFPHPAFHSHRF